MTDLNELREKNEKLRDALKYAQNFLEDDGHMVYGRNPDDGNRIYFDDTSVDE